VVLITHKPRLTTFLHASDEFMQLSCALDSSRSVRTLFVDVKKALDHVGHNILLNKMTSLSVPNCLIGWRFSFLQSRKQRVKLGNLYSGWADMVGGMPQGTWLGPLTFVIYVTDLYLHALSISSLMILR